MKWKDFRIAHAEAQRFLERCHDLMPMVDEWDSMQAPNNQVKSAALKRASMDLSRALSRLRRS